MRSAMRNSRGNANGYVKQEAEMTLDMGKSRGHKISDKRFKNVETGLAEGCHHPDQGGSDPITDLIRGHVGGGQQGHGEVLKGRVQKHHLCDKSFLVNFY